MSDPELFKAPAINGTNMVERTVSVLRRAIRGDNREPVYAKIAAALQDFPELEVRKLKGSKKTPAIQVVKSSDALIRLDRDQETEEGLRERLFDTVTSLNHDLTIEFSNVETVPAGKQRFIVAKPSIKGTGPLYGERMGIFNALDGLLVDPENIRHIIPDMTLIYSGALVTEATVSMAEQVVRDHLPFYADFDFAKIDIQAPKNR